ncbi:hypothetical protein L0V05_07675 [Tabrizicola sp. J26]|uniref:hypothetical protein n=1 Tax=Alitabrizicola rongguiensis TaxID=2909234 RepID=UPI001F3C3FB1|nr:hypothetical protein [Tabrizicola rongguiensis]MCF1708694.1 hypothetical protein [Tabrizicola rongguiensis]
MTTKDLPTHYERGTRLAQSAAIGCSAFAALGTALGYYAAGGHPIVAAAGGLVLAGALGVSWHIAIGAASRARTVLGTTAIILTGFALTAVAIGASAQAVVVTMAGRSALSAELIERVEPISDALATASAQSDLSPLIGSAASIAAGYRAMAGQEAKGAFGKSGEGPRFATLTLAAEGFDTAQQTLTALDAKSGEIHARGLNAIAALRAAAAMGDQAAFLTAAQDVAAAVTDLQSLDPSVVVQTTGIVRVDGETIAGLDAPTQGWVSQAQAWSDNHASVSVPIPAPISLGEAVRAQAFGAALHAWIAAGAIDMLPLIALLLIVSLRAEPLMRDRIQPPEEAEIGEREAALRNRESAVAAGSGISRLHAAE